MPQQPPGAALPAASVAPAAPVALTEVLANLRVVSLPMRVRFRGITRRDAALFEGPGGWAEFSPFPEYVDAEAATWLAAALDFAGGGSPQPVRDRVPVNATVPAVAAADVGTVLARFTGCDTVKVKVAERGQRLADDLARVAAVRRLWPDATVRVDANGGWSVAEAVTALTALAPYELQYAEQPCASVAELAEVRRRLADAGVGVRIAADESVRKAADPLRVAREGAADLIIVKAAPLGGCDRALEVVRQAGLPAVVSSALDTSVGISAGVALAAALPEELFGGAAGLGTVRLFDGDVCEPSLVPEAGGLPLGRVTPESALLDRYAADPDTAAWWRDRITRCYRLLAEGEGHTAKAPPGDATAG